MERVLSYVWMVTLWRVDLPMWLPPILSLTLCFPSVDLPSTIMQVDVCIYT
jgi:hypothetical protein